MGFCLELGEQFSIISTLQQPKTNVCSVKHNTQ
jgi:hypothetical protein